MNKISVIIPVYNVEKFLPQCIESVIKQNYKNLEIICVDDGSTDNCGKILDEYALKDNRIKVIHQKNKGLSEARNIALDIASGYWISFVDSDDFLAPDFYDIMLNAAKKNNADVIQCGYNIYNEHIVKNIAYPSSLLYDKSDILKQMKKCYVWNKLWKKDFIKNNNLHFTPNIYFEDVLFTVTAVMFVKKWESVNYIGYNYRYNPASITHAPEKNQKRSDDRYFINKQVLKNSNLEDTPFYNELKNFMARHLIDVDELMNIETRTKYENLFGRNKIFNKKCAKARRRSLFSVSSASKKLTIFGKSIYFVKRKHES